MSLLVVMAHHDVASRLRRHTLATLHQFAQAAERVVLVSTSGISDVDAASLPDQVSLVTRDDYGGHFYSYRWGVGHVPEYADFDAVLFTDDSYVGLTVPLDNVRSAAEARADVVAMTRSVATSRHLDSYFLWCHSRVTQSRAFRDFFADMTPLRDPRAIHERYEVGLTSTLTDTGFTLGSYFEPTSDDLDLAWERHASSKKMWARAQRRSLPTPPGTPREMDLTVALADRVLTSALPLVSLSTLRDDPYALGSDGLLTACEERFGPLFDGVREDLRAERAVGASTAHPRGGRSTREFARLAYSSTTT